MIMRVSIKECFRYGSPSYFDSRGYLFTSFRCYPLAFSVIYEDADERIDYILFENEDADERIDYILYEV